jgi:hypothetical protein
VSCSCIGVFGCCLDTCACACVVIRKHGFLSVNSVNGLVTFFAMWMFVPDGTDFLPFYVVYAFCYTLVSVIMRSFSALAYTLGSDNSTI